MSRTQEDRVIGQIEEFGPEYFELTQLTRIAPEVYRAIAPAVKDGHIHWQNEAIALLPENSEKVAAAVAGLRGVVQAEAPAESKAGPGDGVAQASRRHGGGGVSEAGGGAAHVAAGERQTMKNLIARTQRDLQRLEGQVWG